MYYDNYGRVIQTASRNHLGGTDYVTNTYNFPGELLTSTRVHTPKTGTATTIITTNDYDHVGRLVATRERIVGQAEVTLTSNSYNEIGQLKGTAVGKAGSETAFVNTTTYSYNERGWLSKSISPRFSQQLKYQDGTNPQWNGNISQQLWGDDATLTGTFSYTYDKLNRLLSGTNGQIGTASIAEVMSYDDMGNIKTLKRDALKVTTYAYEGNRLTGLTGGVQGSYTYDANGNAKTDRQGMVFTYNYLNLPQTAKKTGVDVACLYDAAGTKLQKVSKIGTAPNINTTKRDYINGIEYNNGGIDIIHNSMGYAQKNGTNYVYHYNLKDHLGNIRATLKRGSSATAVDLVQRDNYYPFGKRKVVVGGNNKYLYNGKEIQGELGDQYDYGARFYDAEIGRWNVVDPLAEKGRRLSPYNYAFNNPIRFIDPDGMWPGPGDGILKFFKGFGTTLMGIGQGAAPHNQIIEQVSTAVSAVGSVVKGNYAEAGQTLAESTGIPQAVRTVSKAAQGDAESIGSVAAVITVTAITHKAGAGGKAVTAEGSIAKIVDNVADATGYGPKAAPIRVQGPWTKGDLARAAEGKGPVDFIPTVNRASNKMPLELHHGDQMPGSAIHEVPPAHSKIVPHPNKFNQGVTPLMRQQDAQLHWYFRGLEMGNK